MFGLPLVSSLSDMSISAIGIVWMVLRDKWDDRELEVLSFESIKLQGHWKD